MGVLVGEQVLRWDVDGLEGVNEPTFEFNLPAPTPVFAKVNLTWIIDSSETKYHTAGIWIDSIKRKRPDGLIEEVTINSSAGGDANMTNIKYHILAWRTWVSAMLVLEYWG